MHDRMVQMCRTVYDTTSTHRHECHISYAIAGIAHSYRIPHIPHRSGGPGVGSSPLVSTAVLCRTGSSSIPEGSSCRYQTSRRQHTTSWGGGRANLRNIHNNTNRTQMRMLTRHIYNKILVKNIKYITKYLIVTINQYKLCNHSTTHLRT